MRNDGCLELLVKEIFLLNFFEKKDAIFIKEIFLPLPIL
jgi:hypothetical protein